MAESQESQKPTSWWRRLVGLVWNTAEGDEKNRKYVQKLDSFLFSYICLGYFVKYLDQTNYSNAYVSGMKEDLNLYGNERNWLVTFFNAGIVIGTIPAQMIQLTYIRPSIFIPACELSWSAVVMGMAGAKNIETMYALRFCVGFLESCSFPGYAALLGGWYGPKELTKRTAIFEQTGTIASMFSGYLQAALYSGMNGKHGLAGWRWLFIMDGVISIPIAIWGFFAIPDLPHNTRALYWSAEERVYGVKRSAEIGRAPLPQFTLKSIVKVYTNWRLWVFILPYLFVANSGLGPDYFNLWLSAEGYSVYATNIIPTAGNAFAVISALLFGTFVDRTGRHLTGIVIIEVLKMVAYIMLSVWYIPKGAIFFANLLSYAGCASQSIIIATELNGADPHLRSLLVATGNIFTYTFNMWLPLVLFPTVDAPHYKYGYQILILCCGIGIIGSCVMQWQDRHEKYVPSEVLTLYQTIH
ncbi:hypothetical protein M426DRAFT_268110 [Hypoxylon sp. CI-4A]|nr:hypothetical protein M426DRAFT_268110 [Hypoxylon sp. CI-4A]